MKQFTVTGYVIHENRVLLIWHPKLLKWLPPGGHIEENETPPEGVLREVKEETGLEVAIIRQDPVWVEAWNATSFERPYLCLLENIPPHKDQPAHQHMDLIYLVRPLAPEQQLTTDHGAKWFTLEEVLTLSCETEIFRETRDVIQHLLQEVFA